MKRLYLIPALVQLALISAAVRCQTAVELNDRAIKISSSARGDPKILESAIATLDSAISIDPNYQTAYWNKASILCSEGDFQGSMTALDQILRIHPGRSEALVQKGHLLERIGKYKEAQICYSQVMNEIDSLILIRKATPQNRVSRAILLIFTKDESAGQKEFSRLIKKYPNEPLYKQMQGYYAGFDRKKFISSIGKTRSY